MPGGRAAAKDTCKTHGTQYDYAKIMLATAHRGQSLALAHLQ
jgi:hypothetical protein